MKQNIGITSKLLILYLIFFLIFSGTTIVYYANVLQIIKISEIIVHKRNKISLYSKKMIEHVFSMEENTRKYRLLKKDTYRKNYISAKQGFEINLRNTLALETSDISSANKWEKIYKSYSLFKDDSENSQNTDEAQKSWIPETFLDQWVEMISSAQAENEQQIAMSLLKINKRGELAARNGLIGLSIAIMAGLFGILFLANTITRPLRKIRRGIRSISKDKFSESINIHSNDEFGELAGAFNEMAKRLNEEERMRSDFIAMLSHEIRTPLTSILESVNLIAEEVMGPVNQRQRKFLEIAGSEIGRISNLLNHFMQVSKLESDVLEIEPVLIAPGYLLSKSINQLKPLAKAKNIDFKIQVAPDIPKIMGAPEHLHHVLLNIIGNAIKFSNSGDTIGIYVVSDKSQKRIVFSVSDSGPGILKEEISLIFNKYYRTREAREQMDGIGLGLNISKQIIIAHGGEIWANSVKGKGSIFEFALPFADVR